MKTEGNMGTEFGRPKEHGKDQYYLAEEMINLTEDVADKCDLVFDELPEDTIDTHRAWYSKNVQGVRGNMSRKLIRDIFGLNETMRLYAIDSLSGGGEDCDEIPVEMSKIIEKQGEKQIIAKIDALAVQLGQSLNEAMTMIPESERTPRQYALSLTIPGYFFKRACEILGLSVDISDI